MRFLSAVLLLTQLVCVPEALATLTANVDRSDVHMGETLQLVISSDDGTKPESADLSALRQDFEILQSRTSVNTQLINGRSQQTRALILELTPRREGTLQIPAFAAGGERSAALTVTVGPAVKLSASEEIVLFDAIVDRESVYVQGQLLLTLRIQQAVTLESRSVTELTLDGAFIKNLGQNSFQRTVDGRPWLVHEIRYAIFPEASGELIIPKQTFSGRLASGRRALFDTRSTGQVLSRSSEPLRIDVKPRPARFTGTTWLPAASLELEQQWSASESEIRVGDSITRTVTATGEGLQGAQLPPVELPASPGLRVYPDQPAINEVEGRAGVTGIRSDSLALVAVRPGKYDIPPLTVDWWDTERNEMRQATLPGRTFQVLPAANAQVTATPDPTRTAGTAASPSAMAPKVGYWPWLTALCAGGWMMTLLILWRSRRSVPQADTGNVGARQVQRALLAACSKNNARNAHHELHRWLVAQDVRKTLHEWAAAQGDTALVEAIRELEAQLFGPAADSRSWDGSRLAAALGKLPSTSAGQRTGSGQENSDLPTLYGTR